MTIDLYYKFLKHDIDQLTYRIGGLVIQDVQKRDEAMASSVSTDVSFYRRKIEGAVACLKTRLHDRIVNITKDDDDVLDTEKKGWQIELKDDELLKADGKSVAELMHRFVIRHVLIDWLRLYAPAMVKTYQEEMDEIEEQLTESLYEIGLPKKHRRKRIDNSGEVTIVTEGAEWEDIDL